VDWLRTDFTADRKEELALGAVDGSHHDLFVQPLPVPTYNERDRLRDLVNAIFAAAAAEQLDGELIIVDHNSPMNVKEALGDIEQLRELRRFERRRPKLRETYRRLTREELQSEPLKGV
jgi:hypothetical protein